MDVSIIGTLSGFIPQPTLSDHQQHTLYIITEVGFGAVDAFAEIGLGMAKAAVLNSLTAGGYGVYEIGKAMWTGYDRNGVLGALDSINVLAQFIDSAQEATLAAMHGDFRAAGKAGTSTLVLGASIVLAAAEGAAALEGAAAARAAASGAARSRGSLAKPALEGDPWSPAEVAARRGTVVQPNGPLAAKAHGYERRIARNRAPFDSHGQEVYSNGKTYITPDVDSHNGGTWKMFDRRGNRLGTFDADLSKIGE